MQSSKPSEKKCSICNKTTSQHCKKCGCSLYCSSKCQKVDWPLHKLICGQFKNFSTPPDKSFKRGIFFPENETGARFVWVACVWKPATREHDGFEEANVEEYIGDCILGHVWIQKNLLRSRTLEKTINVVHREAFLKDGSMINRSVVEVTKGLMGHSWRGPILALKQQDLSLDSGYDDMDTVDFRDVIDYFCAYGDKNLMNLADMSLGGKSARAVEEVSGVRISCRGDQICGRDKFEAVKVPRDHPIFNAPVTSISKLIGMPIYVRRCPPDKKLQNTKYDRSNQAATFLHLNADPADEGWGWAPMDWQEPAGSVIVIRKDGKALQLCHIEALCHFCQYVLQPIFEDSLGSGMHPEKPISKAEVLSRMTPRGFENFYIGYDNYKRDSDPNREYFPPPDLVE